MATAATAEKPTKNLPASCQLLARLLPPAPLPKKRYGCEGAGEGAGRGSQ
jgi:hypothetical protein